ncbi:hypothetical protein [Actinomadura sp. WMMB 499]|uniref:hypothetical protein n=1 Tax=Actinomadura sp. WMMB 499 TaxID=1219491 RepID=UPI0020C79B28|nr:hypothetical protein [Actinomadura sp. WMMB 499]
MTDAMRVTVHGWCEVPEERIAAIVRSGRAGSLTGAHGQFVIAVDEDDRVTLIAGRSGAVVHVYDTCGTLAHGGCVGDALDAAGRGLRWNVEAVADYLRFGHLLGDASLDAGLRTVPAGAVVTLTRDGHRVAVPDPPPAPEPSPDGAVDALRGAVARAAGTGGCALSMSGGLDARLLLAALLAGGHRPHLLISGVPGSFDREVATGIARTLGLPHTVRAVPAAALDAGADRIAWRTSGLLPVTNWAGMAHLAEDPPDVPVLLGYHGEYARPYYLPARGRAAARAARRPARDAAELLARRFPDPFRPAEHARLVPELGAALAPDAARARLAAVLPARGSLGAAAGEFFRAQYGHHKIGANLAALGDRVHWRVPLLDPAWTGAVAALPYRWRLGDRWHRYAIGRLCPRLLDHPEEGYGARTARRPPVRYRTRGPRPPEGPFYVDRSAFLAGPVPDGAVRRAGRGLDGLLDPAAAAALLARDADRLARPHLCFALDALARWRGHDA